MIAEVRGSGLMIGIELCAPRSRSARLTYRLIQRASEGLFPQLIVIPLHRDHGVITMAAGQERRDQAAAARSGSPRMTRSRFLSAFDAVLTDCERSQGKNWSVVRDIALSTLARRSHPKGR